jgi:hypothetical protein
VAVLPYAALVQGHLRLALRPGEERRNLFREFGLLLLGIPSGAAGGGAGELKLAGLAQGQTQAEVGEGKDQHVGQSRSFAQHALHLLYMARRVRLK